MPRIVRVGELDQLIWIDRRVETVVDGDVQRSWVPESQVWAQIEPSSVGEFFGAMAQQFRATHRVTIRSRPSLTSSHRFRWNGLPLNIVGPLVGSTRQPYTRILCELGVTDGI